MTLNLKPQPLPTKIDLPSSKSYANRLLIVSSRLGQGRKITDLPESDDVTHLVNCLQKIGLSLSIEKNQITFHNTFPECEITSSVIHLNVGEGGTTARFLLSLLSTGKNKYVLEMEGRLSARPWQELIEILTRAGAKIEWIESNQLSIQGPVKVNLLPDDVSCTDTTQFITSLQLVFFKENKFFKPIKLNSSEAYWQMTLECLQDFKIKSVPKDWSSASYPMVLAALKNERVFFPGLKKDRFQADSILLDILSERGCIDEDPSGIWVQGMKSSHPFELDGSHCLDLIPTLVALALKLEGKSIIKNTQGLKSKESDRQVEIVKTLKEIGANFNLSDNQLEVTGPIDVKKMKLKPVLDHRMVMMSAVILLSHEGGEIENEKAVTKSFPDFFKIVAPTLKD